MDVYLPDGDGLDVVRTLLERERHPDVIVITAARDMATVRTAMQLGAVHYLVKPFGFAALSERLTAYRRLLLRIDGLPGEADQTDVDELFGILHGRPAPPLVRPRATPPRPWSWSATPSAPTGEDVSAVRGGGDDRHQPRDRPALPDLSRTLRRASSCSCGTARRGVPSTATARSEPDPRPRRRGGAAGHAATTTASDDPGRRGPAGRSRASASRARAGCGRSCRRPRWAGTRATCLPQVPSTLPNSTGSTRITAK